MKQEKFCVNYFACGNATQAAIKAGYSRKTAHSIATENLQKPAIIERLKNLQEKAFSERIMSVQERKERLSEIARARMADLVTCGPDGSWVNVGLDGCQSAAIQGIRSTTEYDANGAKPTIITDIKLHDPIRAIAELNKMEHVYEMGPVIGNMTVNIISSIPRPDYPMISPPAEGDNDNDEQTG
jgi:phage terminase small subunit